MATQYNFHNTILSALARKSAEDYRKERDAVADQWRTDMFDYTKDRDDILDTRYDDKVKQAQENWKKLFGLRKGESESIIKHRDAQTDRTTELTPIEKLKGEKSNLLLDERIEGSGLQNDLLRYIFATGVDDRFNQQQYAKNVYDLITQGGPLGDSYVVRDMDGNVINQSSPYLTERPIRYQLGPVPSVNPFPGTNVYPKEEKK